MPHNNRSTLGARSGSMRCRSLMPLTYSTTGCELPTLTMMIQAYFGIEKTINANDPMAMAEAMRAMGGTGVKKAQKVTSASPAIDQQRFACASARATGRDEEEEGKPTWLIQTFFA